MKLSKFKLSIHKWTQRKPPQMGEDESGDLKTPLKTKIFINFIQCALRILIFERTFQIKAK